jgi:hypothetical protein
MKDNVVKFNRRAGDVKDVKLEVQQQHEEVRSLDTEMRQGIDGIRDSAGIAFPMLTAAEKDAGIGIVAIEVGVERLVKNVHKCSPRIKMAIAERIANLVHSISHL